MHYCASRRPRDRGVKTEATSLLFCLVLFCSVLSLLSSRKLQNSTRQRKSALCAEDSAGSVVGAWIAGDVSPGGTLTRSVGNDTLKSRSNARSYSKLQSLFSLVKVKFWMLRDILTRHRLLLVCFRLVNLG